MATVDVACPSEQRIAAFVDGALPGAERAELQRHVDGCADCFALVGTVSSQLDRPLPHVDEGLRDAALKRPETAPWMYRHLPALTAAAALILAVAWWAPRVHGPALSPPAAATDLPTDAVTRSGATDSVVVEQPRDGEMVSAQPEVRWTAPSETVAFEIVVTSDAGDVLWRRRIAGVDRTTRIDASLPPGRVCYLWVAAELPEGRRLKSNVVKLHAAGS